MKILLIPLLLSAGLPPEGKGQALSVADSLFSELQKAPESDKKVDILNELAWIYRNTNPKRAFGYANEGLDLASKLKYKEGKATSYNRLGVAEKNNGNYQSALMYYELALKLRIESGDRAAVANTLLNIGNIHRRLGELERAKEGFSEGLEYLAPEDRTLIKAKLLNALGTINKHLGEYEEAIKNFLESSKLREELGDFKSAAVGHLSMGALYEKLGHYGAALESYQKSLSIYERIEDTLGMVKCFNNIGNAYYYQNEDAKAQAFYLKALSEEEAFIDSAVVGVIYNNLGAIYESQNQLEQALAYNKRALDVREKLNDRKGIAGSYNKLGNIERQSGNLNKSLEYYLKSYALAKDAGDKILEMEVLNNLSLANSLLGNHKKSFQYLLDYGRLKDSLYQSYKGAMDYKLKYEENQLKLAKLETESLALQKRRNYYQAFAVILLLTSLALFLALRSAKQTEKLRQARMKEQLALNQVDDLLLEQELRSTQAKLEGQDIERRRLAKDLHDRLGAMLATIQLYFQAVEDKIDNMQEESKVQYDKANDLLGKACEEVRKISYDMQSVVLTKFGLGPQLKELVETINGANKLNVQLLTYGLSERLENTTEYEIYKIIQELAGNVLKHAQANELIIQLNRHEGYLNIMVEDDGKGFNKEQRQEGAGQGLKNVESRVHKLNGDFNIDSGKGSGTTITINIPVETIEYD